VNLSLSKKNIKKNKRERIGNLPPRLHSPNAKNIEKLDGKPFLATWHAFTASFIPSGDQKWTAHFLQT